jgi:hypothetical protein
MEDYDNIISYCVNRQFLDVYFIDDRSELILKKMLNTNLVNEKNIIEKIFLDFYIVELVLEYNINYLNCKNFEGQSLLHCYFDKWEYLLHKGINVNLIDNNGNNCLMHYLAYANFWLMSDLYDKFELLIEKRLDLLQRNNNNELAIHLLKKISDDVIYNYLEFETMKQLKKVFQTCTPLYNELIDVCFIYFN